MTNLIWYSTQFNFIILNIYIGQRFSYFIAAERQHRSEEENRGCHFECASGLEAGVSRTHGLGERGEPLTPLVGLWRHWAARRPRLCRAVTVSLTLNDFRPT